MVTTGNPDRETDPILVRRDRYRRLAALALRLGYVLLGLAVVAFFAGIFTGFRSPAVTVTVAGLVGACLLLPPAIIAGYAVKAADREDRDAGRLPGQPGHSARGDTVH
jgi:hypothetical protein